MNCLACVMCVQLLICFSVSELYEGKYEDDDCDLDNNVRGKCIRLSQCPSAIEIVYKREHPVTCSFVRFTPIVCCPVVQIIKTRFSEQKCLAYRKVKLKSTEEPPTTPLDRTKLNITFVNPDIPVAPLTADLYAGLPNKNFTSSDFDSDILSQEFIVRRQDIPQEENKTEINTIENKEILNIPLDIALKNPNLTNSEEIGTVYIRFNYTEDTSKEVQDPFNITILNITKSTNSNGTQIYFDELFTNVTEVNVTKMNVSANENVSSTTDSTLTTTYDYSVFNFSEKTIVLGSEAKIEEFPHMATLGFSNKEDRIWRCGGSLVSEKFVLTAAHCLSSPDYGVVEWVSLGSNRINLEPNSKPNFYQKIFKITHRIPHPSYKRPSTYHDIALVELERPVEFTTSIRPACLPATQEVDPQEQLVATGWGLTEFAGNASETLQKVDLDVYSAEECAKTYDDMSGTRRLRSGIVEEVQFCAGGRKGEQDTCNGDSGGPLQLKIDDSNGAVYSIIGITSFGKTCGLQGVPGVYVRVAQYVSWLESVIWPDEF